MRLRHKKTNNLSEDVLYSEFQNQHFQTFPKKSDFIRKPNYDESKNVSIMDSNKSTYAQILTKFIINSNLAKQRRQKKVQIKHKIKNIGVQQYCRVKRMRKTSDNVSLEQQKKIQCPNSAFTNTNSITKKQKTQQKRERSSNVFSTNRISQSLPDAYNLMSQIPQQNIINNYFIGNTLNIDYSHFLQSHYFPFNQAIWNSWLQINPFLKPNLQNISLSLPAAEQMRTGLYRQLQIYERFKSQTNLNLEEIQKKPLPFSSTNKIQQPEKNQKRTNLSSSTNKVSPDKIFKRASYHVAIAYSIYMDNIQKQGRNIKNFSDIDPTRFAKKYKMSKKTT